MRASTASLISDDELLRDRRPPEQLRRELYASTILRLARLRRLGRFSRVEDALAAIAKAHDMARAAPESIGDFALASTPSPPHCADRRGIGPR